MNVNIKKANPYFLTTIVLFVVVWVLGIALLEVNRRLSRERQRADGLAVQVAAENDQLFSSLLIPRRDAPEIIGNPAKQVMQACIDCHTRDAERQQNLLRVAQIQVAMPVFSARLPRLGWAADTQDAFDDAQQKFVTTEDGRVVTVVETEE